MALQPTQTPLLTGVALTHAAAANGDFFNNNGKTFLSVKNGDGSAHVVTITSQVPCNQGVTHNPAVSVAAGAEELIGPFPTDRFNDVNGQVQVAYAALTSMTVAVLST